MFSCFTYYLLSDSEIDNSDGLNGFFELFFTMPLPFTMCFDVIIKMSFIFPSTTHSLNAKMTFSYRLWHLNTVNIIEKFAQQLKELFIFSFFPLRMYSIWNMKINFLDKRM